MIKLDKPIKINPPPYTWDNKIIYPNAIILDTLNVTYVDNPNSRVYYASIENIPSKIYLLVKDEYDKYAENINNKLGEERLLLALGNHPETVLKQLFPKTLEEHPYGAGTILSKIIKFFGIKITNSCSCKKHAIEMNEKGNDWCEQNIDTILDWLHKEASDRKIPFVRMLAKIIIKYAITKSRKLLLDNKNYAPSFI